MRMRMAEESLGKRGTAHAQEHLNQGHSEDAALIRQNRVQADLPAINIINVHTRTSDCFSPDPD